MDGYIDDVLSNFDVCNSILCKNGILKRRYKDTNSTLQMFSPLISAKLKDVQPCVDSFIQKHEKIQKDPRYVFDDEVVRFNFKLPSYLQR